MPAPAGRRQGPSILANLHHPPLSITTISLPWGTYPSHRILPFFAVDLASVPPRFKGETTLKRQFQTPPRALIDPYTLMSPTTRIREDHLHRRQLRTSLPSQPEQITEAMDNSFSFLFYYLHRFKRHLHIFLNLRPARATTLTPDIPLPDLPLSTFLTYYFVPT